jgi:hypothetical protein
MTDTFIHTPEGELKLKIAELPEDIKGFLKSLTSLRGCEDDLYEICDDTGRSAAEYCDKYKIRYIKEYQDGILGMREVYSDGTYGEWQ